MRPRFTLALALATVIGARGCGNSGSSSAPCAHGNSTVTTRSGPYDFVVALSPPGPRPAPIHIRGMAGATQTHLDVLVCPAGKDQALRGPDAVTLIDRSSGTRARLPLAPHGADSHMAANVNVPHHAEVEINYRGRSVTLIPPTD